MANGGGLPQQPAGPGGPRLRPARNGRRHRWSGHRAFAQGRGAAGAEELVKFPGRQHQQQPFANRLRATALRAVKFTRGEGAKLL